MKAYFAILALAMGSLAWGQSTEDYGAQDAIVVPVQTEVSSPEIQSQSASGNPIYILNDQRLQGYQGTNQQAHQGTLQGQSVIQEQPVSVVQDSPLRASPAEMMRKRRQQSEAATEDGIVQALERARLDDEIRRRDKFNNAIAPVVTETPQTSFVQQPQVVQQVVPAPVAPAVVEPSKKRYRVVEDYEDEEAEDLRETKREEKVDIRSEIRAAIEESQVKPEEKSMNYIAGLASFGDYDNVVNINRSLGYGFAVGTVLPERIVVEGSFIYGNYELEDIYRGVHTYSGYYPLIVDMRQYNIAGAVKYSVLPGRFRPLAGAVLSYTRRTYSQGSHEFRTSDAVDVGALFGADLHVSDNFAVGVDFRYMTNLGYKQNLNQRQSFVYTQSKNDPERLDYYSLNLLGKFTF